MRILIHMDTNMNLIVFQRAEDGDLELLTPQELLADDEDDLVVPVVLPLAA